jgi:plastocyanin
MLRRSVVLGSALLAAACGTSSPSVAPSPLGTSVPVRLGAIATPATQHEHNHAAATVISIVGSAGTAAYLPNPLQVATGSMIVWMNVDLVPHNIVLSDGTPVGTVNPGEMTPAVMMNTPTLSYHCTIHPSMRGTIADPAAVTPAPDVPGATPEIPGSTPMPDPMPMPPVDEYYPYPDPGDGYYDY